MRKIVPVLVALSAMAAPAAAQQEGHAQHGQAMHAAEGMRGMQHCMAMMGGPPPAMLLHHSEQLGLSEEQVSRLEGLRDDAAVHPHMMQAMAAHARGAEALDGDAPDWAAYEEAVRGAADHMVQGHLAMARAAVAANEVLTPAQREQLATMGRGMGDHVGMMGEDAGMMGEDGGMEGHGAGHMGMMGCMMMGGMHGAGPHGEDGAGQGH